MGRSRWLATSRLAVVALVACNASAQLVLKAPIQAKCSDAGLRGCEELTDGVLLYVEGDHAAAETKIKHGAAANQPDQVREFAAKLRLLKNVPGADEYVAPLLQVAELLAPGSESSAGAAATPPREGARARPGELAVLAGVSVPAADDRAQACLMYQDTLWKSDLPVARCVNVATGPVVLTDARTMGACPNMLLVGAGEPSAPRWIIAAQPSTVLAMHGARFTVPAGDSLFVAQGGPKADDLSHSAACAIAWAVQPLSPR